MKNISDSPPSAMRTILQNRWFSETFREQALNKAVSCALKVRRATTKVKEKFLRSFKNIIFFQYQDGFLSTFLTLIEDMTPVFAWGILGPDSSVKPMCTFIKARKIFQSVENLLFFQDTVLDFARSLYDLQRTDYSSLTALTNDVDRQMNNLLSTIVKEMNVDPNILLLNQPLRTPTVRFN